MGARVGILGRLLRGGLEGPVMLIEFGPSLVALHKVTQVWVSGIHRRSITCESALTPSFDLPTRSKLLAPHLRKPIEFLVILRGDQR